jgi:hypothetical protein
MEQKEHESREWEARMSREQSTELEKQRACSEQGKQGAGMKAITSLKGKCHESVCFGLNL